MSDGDGGADGKLPALEPGRSLVVAERRRRARRSVVKPPAGFVAQLIACEENLGDFRRARRQGATVGAARYHAPLTVADTIFETTV